MGAGATYGPEDDDSSTGGADQSDLPARPDIGRGGASRLPVLTAIADPVLEAQVVAALTASRSRLAVVRRCVDLPDLLAGAAAGTARAVLVSADLRRLDQEALTRLRRLGLAVVGLNDDAAIAAERAEARLRQLGVQWVVPASSTAPLPPDELAGRLAQAAESAVAALDVQPNDDPGEAPTTDAPDPTTPVGEPWALDDEVEAVGRVVAVWGPTGAPGRSFVSWQLAAALAAAGRRVLLVDADTYGGTLSQYAGVVDEASGLVAACRAANAGALDTSRLAASAVTLPVGADGGVLTLLTGISRPHRWPEVRPAALGRVLEVARLLADDVLVDCGFALEEDEELSYDTLAPQRNGATVAVLGSADDVLAIGSADPVGLTRLVTGLGDLREVLSSTGAAPDVHVVVNRVRSGSRSRRQVLAAVERHAGTTPLGLLPLDVAVADRSLEEGRPVGEIAPRTPLAAAVDGLAAALVPGVETVAAATSATRWRSRRR